MMQWSGGIDESSVLTGKYIPGGGTDIEAGAGKFTGYAGDVNTLVNNVT